MIGRNEVTAIQLFYLKALVQMVTGETEKLFERLVNIGENKDAYQTYKALASYDKTNSLVRSLEEITGEDEFEARTYPNMRSIFSIVKPGIEGYVQKNKTVYSWQYISEEGMPYELDGIGAREYKEAFTKDLEELTCKFNREKLDVFIQKYGSFIAWGKDNNYISVYHRMKTNISVLDSMEEGHDYLLIGADLSGIQDFIYTISSDTALKTLRARSFYLECLVEYTASRILEHLGLSKYNLIYSGGGGFNILARANKKAREYIKKLYQDINRDLFYLFQGKIYMALDSVSIPNSALLGSSSRDLSSAFKNLAERLQYQKVTKYRYMLDEVLDIRDPDYAECSVCHATGITILDNSEHFDEPVCRLCDEFARLGQNLKKEGYGYVSMEEKLIPLKNGMEVNHLIIELHQKPEYIADKDYYMLNGFDLEGYYPGCKGNIIAGNYSYKGQKNVDFDYFADISRGASLIGALRMDVDDLGSLFSKRIPEENRSLEAYTALSHFTNLFFKYYLNQICNGKIKDQFEVCFREEKIRKVAIVYSGGDDLFIIGSWDDVAEIGFDIRNAFQKFIGGDNVTLSGGMTIHKPKFPLYQMAELSSRAEARAKDNEHDMHKKDSYCMFYSDWLDATISAINKHDREMEWNRKDVLKGEFFWEKSEDIAKLTKAFYCIIQQVPHGYVNKLFQVLDIYRYEDKFYLPHMYRIVMNIGKKLKDDKISDANEMIGLLEDLYSEKASGNGISVRDMNLLHIPLTWAEYLNRG